MIDQQVHRDQREHLAVRRLKQTAHILTAHLKAAPGDAGDHVVIPALLVPQRAQALNARDLIARRAIILGQLGLDESNRRKLIRDNEIRRLVESGNPPITDLMIPNTGSGSQRRRVTWTRMKAIADRYLPFPRILHPWPEKRFLVTIQGGSPVR